MAGTAVSYTHLDVYKRQLFTLVETTRLERVPDGEGSRTRPRVRGSRGPEASQVSMSPGSTTTGIRLWTASTSGPAAVVTIVQLWMRCLVSRGWVGSRQVSQSPAKVRGSPSDLVKYKGVFGPLPESDLAFHS